MKTIKHITIGFIMVFILGACQSVRVSTDYDQTVDFNQYQTFAFYKPSIDKAKISDLDKRRILKAIDRNLTAKGMTKSQKPDLLIGIMTESTKNINVHQHYYGWYGYAPYYSPFYHGWWPGQWRYSEVEGTLYINLIDASNHHLVWQGMGTGDLEPRGTVDEKIEHINIIVQKILEKYPPGNKSLKKAS